MLLTIVILAVFGPVNAATLTSPGGTQPETTKPVLTGQGALFYSSWVKVCQKEPKQLCFIVANGRVETGQVAVSAMLIEPEGASNKILRITLPLAMQLQAGTRLAIDQNPPINAPYILCDNTGCMSDYNADAGLIEQLKNGQRLILQAVERQGQTINFVVPLADFAIAFDSPPIDAKLFEEQQKKLQDKLQKRASNKPKDQNSQTKARGRQ